MECAVWNVFTYNMHVQSKAYTFLISQDDVQMSPGTQVSLHGSGRAPGITSPVPVCPLCGPDLASQLSGRMFQVGPEVAPEKRSIVWHLPSL